MIFLIRKKNGEIFTSVMKFLKRYFKERSDEEIYNNLEVIMKELHDQDEKQFSTNRMKIKTLIQIL